MWVFCGVGREAHGQTASRCKAGRGSGSGAGRATMRGRGGPSSRAQTLRAKLLRDRGSRQGAGRSAAASPRRCHAAASRRGGQPDRAARQWLLRLLRLGAVPGNCLPDEPRETTVAHLPGQRRRSWLGAGMGGAATQGCREHKGGDRRLLCVLVPAVQNRRGR
eukprot:6283886-Prymnesium_polylepis.1